MPKFLKGLLWVAGLTGLVVLLLRALLFKVWTVPDDPILAASLAPSLNGGDVVLVLTKGERGVGDLVRCTDPEDAQRWVVGRIYGTPGDRVAVSNGIVSINGRRYATTEACLEDSVDTVDPRSGAPVKISCSRVEVAGGWHFMGRGAETASHDIPEHTVGADRFFLISDNRSSPEDSRHFGAVFAAQCVDKISFRLWGKEGFGASKHRFDVIR